jgi:hypothetical protein
MGIMGGMGFMGGMGMADGQGGRAGRMGRTDGQDGRTGRTDRTDGHKKYGQAFGDEGLPVFYTIVFILCFILAGSPVRPLLLFYRIARETDAEFLEDLTVNL